MRRPGALIGRDRELAEVADRLATRRLVTLIGPAGIGKTAVAAACAAGLADRYEAGVHQVDLTRVDDPAAVAGALAAQLGFGSWEGLLEAPSDVPALVVVDNCEHVLGAAADAVEGLLEACAAPTVLATSRSPLALPGESLVVLGPLGVPAPGEADPGSDAVRLFLERARDAGAGLGDDDAVLVTVGELCRRLDGLPLALELAAARTRILTPADVLERLDRDVDLLARSSARGDRRHRSLTTTIEWSYRLLPPAVAQVLDRLGVFAGPIPASMAQAVAVDAGIQEGAAIDALATLVDSSLLVAESVAGTSMFRLLQTVRSFAVHRLRSQGLEHDARRRLADHVAAAAVEIIGAGARRWDRATLGQLLFMYDTVASTLRWCLAHDDEPDRALLLCAVLWGVVHQGHTDEIGALAEAALERWPAPDAPFAPEAAATAATARVLLGDPQGALDLATARLASASSSATAPVTLRRAMGYALRSLGDRAGALAMYGEVADAARERDLLALALEADVTRAQLLADDDLDEAIALAAAVQREATAAGSTVNEVWAGTILAHLHLRAGATGALAEVREVLAAARRIDYPAAESVNLRSMAWGSVQLGRVHDAAAALHELFAGLLARSGVADVRGALYTSAEVLDAASDPVWAVVLASAEALPLVGPTSAAVDGLTRLVAPEGVEPLPRWEAIAVARAALQRILEGGGGDGGGGGGEGGGGGAVAPAAGSVAAERSGVGAAPAARFVDRGGFYELEFAGRSVHVKAGKGLADLARLLAAPGRELHCVDLMGGAVDQPSTGETIDETARRQYEQRIRDLYEDIEQAEADNDFLRAERAQVELDALVEQLGAALGLGGRARSGAGASVERARSAVTQRIRSTIRRLGDDHPELARHLQAAVVTGTYCAYKPEHPVAWQLTP